MTAWSGRKNTQGFDDQDLGVPVAAGTRQAGRGREPKAIDMRGNHSWFGERTLSFLSPRRAAARRAGSRLRPAGRRTEGPVAGSRLAGGWRDDYIHTHDPVPEQGPDRDRCGASAHRPCDRPSGKLASWYPRGAHQAPPAKGDPIRYQTGIKIPCWWLGDCRGRRRRSDQPLRRAPKRWPQAR